MSAAVQGRSRPASAARSRGPLSADGSIQGKLKLHGWVYKIETGEVFGYDPESAQFLLLTEQRSLLSVPERKLVALEI